MTKRLAIKTVAACLLLTGAMGQFGLANAQTKLKWAHVYETSEPYHKWSVWAADEFKKRTNGKYEIQVFPASSLSVNDFSLSSESCSKPFRKSAALSFRFLNLRM